MWLLYLGVTTFRMSLLLPLKVKEMVPLEERAVQKTCTFEKAFAALPLLDSAAT